MLGAAAACSAANRATGGATRSGNASSEIPVAGGTLRIGMAKPAGLDPARARSLEQLFLADQLFDGLTAYDQKTRAAAPAVASSWTSTDLRTWDFVLRADARFGNGRVITAADVRYTFERVARPGGAPLETAQLLDLVNGFDAFRAQSKPAPMLAGVSVVDDKTVRIVLDQPWADFPLALANPALGIVAREAVEAPAPAPPFADQPIGSGPFTTVSVSDTRIVLGPAPGSRALVEQVRVDLFDSTGAAYEAFRSGKLDWARVPVDQVDDATTRFGSKAFSAYEAELFYGFNLRAPAFADARFREAIVRAVNREAILKAVYGGTVTRLDGVVTSGVPGFVAMACGEHCAYDPAASKALLIQAFPPPATPPTVAIDYDADPTYEVIGKAVQADLAAVGITVTLRPKPLKEYDDFVQQGSQQLFREAWVAAYPSPDAFLPPLFGSRSPDNLVGLAVPAIDKLLAEARAEGDATKRQALFTQAERVILAQTPILPLGQFQLFSVTSTRVRNLAPTVTGTFDASAVWLAGPP